MRLSLNGTTKINFVFNGTPVNSVLLAEKPVSSSLPPPNADATELKENLPLPVERTEPLEPFEEVSHVEPVLE
jgi:hypothetical protein